MHTGTTTQAMHTGTTTQAMQKPGLSTLASFTGSAEQAAASSVKTQAIHTGIATQATPYLALSIFDSFPGLAEQAAVSSSDSQAMHTGIATQAMPSLGLSIFDSFPGLAEQAAATGVKTPGLPTLSMATQPNLASATAQDCNATSSTDGKVTSPYESRVQPPYQLLGCAAIIAESEAAALAVEQAPKISPEPASLLPPSKAASSAAPTKAASSVATQEVDIDSLLPESKSEINEIISSPPSATTTATELVVDETQAHPHDGTAVPAGSSHASSPHDADAKVEPSRDVGQVLVEPKEQDVDYVPHIGDEDESSTSLPPANEQSPEMALPEYNTDMDLLEYARQCAPALYQAAGLQLHHDAAPSTAVIETLLGIFKKIKAASATSGTGSKGSPIDVETHKPNLSKAAKELEQERHAALSVEFRASHSPTANAIHTIQSMVGISCSSMTLRLPPVAYSLPVIPDEHEEYGYPLFMKDIRTLEAGEELNDAAIETMFRIMVNDDGWTTIDDRALLPLNVAESLKTMNPYEDNSESVLLTFPFMTQPAVNEIIWIMHYVGHWVTCTATADGLIKIYNSMAHHNPKNIAQQTALRQVLAMTSSGHVHEQWRKQEWVVEFEDCPQQHNSVDCGVYAIECALDLFKLGQLTSTTRDVPTLRLMYIEGIRFYVEKAIEYGDYTPIDDNAHPEGELNTLKSGAGVSGENPTTTPFRAIVEELPWADEEQLNLAKTTNRIWTRHPKAGEEPREAFTLVWDRPRRSRACIAASFVASRKLQRATWDSIVQEVYYDAVDTRLNTHRRPIIGQVLKPLPENANIYEFAAKSYAAIPAPKPILRIPGEASTFLSLSNDIVTCDPYTFQDELPLTIYVVQVRFSGGATYTRARSLMAREQELWLAFQERFVIARDVEMVDLNDENSNYDALLSLNAHRHGYVHNHQWDHGSNHQLLIDDNDETAARQLLDEAQAAGLNLHVVVIGNGMDGLSTRNTSWKALQSRWPNATFEICLFVPNPKCSLIQHFPHTVTTRDEHVAVIRMHIANLAQAYLAMQERGHVKIPHILDNQDVVAQLDRYEAIVYTNELYADLKELAREWARAGWAQEFKDLPLAELRKKYCRKEHRNTFPLALAHAPRATVSLPFERAEAHEDKETEAAVEGHEHSNKPRNTTPGDEKTRQAAEVDSDQAAPEHNLDAKKTKKTKRTKKAKDANNTCYCCRRRGYDKCNGRRPCNRCTWRNERHFCTDDRPKFPCIPETTILEKNGLYICGMRASGNHTTPKMCGFSTTDEASITSHRNFYHYTLVLQQKRKTDKSKGEEDAPQRKKSKKEDAA